MSDLKRYLPSIYKDVREMDVLTNTEDELFDELAAVLLAGQNNQFIIRADESGIKEFEKIIGIISNSAEPLELRRQRVLNRFSTGSVFTIKSLEQKLNEMVGVNAWDMYMDYPNYTLYIESSAENQEWYNEVLITVNSIKPANIVFINRPLVRGGIKTNETISGSQRLRNYKLGVSWQLGALPFASMNNMGEIKMSASPSIKNNLLSDLALFTANDIAKVRVNGTYIITEFLEKKNEGNQVTVQYSIPVSSGIPAVTKLEFLNSEDQVLTESSVYVPSLTELILKHTISVSEG